MIPGIYNIAAGRAEVKPDGSIIFNNLIMKPAPSTAEERPLNLEDVWKKDAPFTFDYFISELTRNGVINKDGKWDLYPIRGNHRTCSVHVRALYEVTLSYNCIDELSFPQVQQIFNNTFTTDIKCSKVIENKNRCLHEYDYFDTMFSAFANPDTNAESN